MKIQKEEEKKKFSIIEKANVIIMSFAYIGLFFSGFLVENKFYNGTIGVLGWMVWIFGLLLAFAPNVVFKRRGGVKQGKSYIHTTKLVDDGIYGIIRHSQYTGGIVIAFSMCLIAQTWLTYLLSLIAISTTYLSMILEEKDLIRKFGSQYREYMKKVPRMNILLGLIRKLKQKK